METVRTVCGKLNECPDLIIMIIMYTYRALINALSVHAIHINLNKIFYSHVTHSPIKNNLHKVVCGNTHTHARTHAFTHTHTRGNLHS